MKTKVKFLYHKKCGYEQPSISIEAKGTDLYEIAKALGMSVLIGLGLATLLYFISGSGGKNE